MSAFIESQNAIRENAGAARGRTGVCISRLEAYNSS